jgi:hypothetical protein
MNPRQIIYNRAKELFDEAELKTELINKLLGGSIVKLDPVAAITSYDNDSVKNAINSMQDSIKTAMTLANTINTHKNYQKNKDKIELLRAGLGYVLASLKICKSDNIKEENKEFLEKIKNTSITDLKKMKDMLQQQSAVVSVTRRSSMVIQDINLVEEKNSIERKRVLIDIAIKKLDHPKISITTPALHTTFTHDSPTQHHLFPVTREQLKVKT